MKWLSLPARIILGGVFVAAAIPKILDPPSFAHMIYNYRLVPGPVLNILALILPWLELLCGIALLSGIWKRPAAGIIGLLLLVFMTALGMNIARDHAVNCGCFDLHAAKKSHAELITEMKWVLLRDAGLMLCVVLAVDPTSRKNEFSTD